MLLADKLEDREELKYKAQLKVYDIATRAYAKELDRLKKLRDGLSTKQIQANEAYGKYIANQENASARLEFTASEAFRRTVFSANASMARAMMFAGVRGTSGARNIDPTVGDIGKKAGDDGTTPAESAAAYNTRLDSAVAAPKDNSNADIGFSIAMDAHINRSRQQYIDLGFDEKSANEAAYADVSSGLSVGDQDRMKNGYALRTGVPTGSVGIIKDGKIEAIPLDSAGAIAKFGYDVADYTKLIKNVDDRMSKLNKPGVPDAPIPGDLKEQQRDLYFDAMFPDDDPAYQLNRVMRGLPSMTDEELMADIQRLTGYSASGVTDMGTGSAGSANGEPAGAAPGVAPGVAAGSAAGSADGSDNGAVAGAPMGNAGTDSVAANVPTGSGPTIASLQAQASAAQREAVRKELEDVAAQRVTDSIAQDKVRKNNNDLAVLEESPADRDTRLRTEAALAAKQSYEKGLAEKKRKTSVGQEVSALWAANRNKGNESLAEQLDNIARTYKGDEQKLAAEVLYGLEYEEKRSTRMG